MNSDEPRYSRAAPPAFSVRPAGNVSRIQQNRSPRRELINRVLLTLLLLTMAVGWGVFCAFVAKFLTGFGMRATSYHGEVRGFDVYELARMKEVFGVVMLKGTLQGLLILMLPLVSVLRKSERAYSGST